MNNENKKVLSLKQLKEQDIQGWDFWVAIDPLFELKRCVYGMYGIGCAVNCIDGIGTVLTLHGRAVDVSLKSINVNDELHGFSKGNGGLHRTYLFKDFDCPLRLKRLSAITDEEAIRLCKIDNRLGVEELAMTNEKRIARGRNNVHFIINQVEAYQYLQQLEYALPLFCNGIKFSVTDLIGLGLYEITIPSKN